MGRNLIGHITEEQDSVYTVATSHGTISTRYTRNQFDIFQIQYIGGLTLLPYHSDGTNAMFHLNSSLDPHVNVSTISILLKRD